MSRYWGGGEMEREREREREKEHNTPPIAVPLDNVFADIGLNV